MMKNKNFAALIISHGRAGRVQTEKTLRRLGYTGKTYIIVDDEDKEVPEYKKEYGDSVIVFSKDEARKYCDPMDNFNDRRTPLYARNMIWNIAKELGLDYFVEFDDDYGDFFFKYDKDKVFRSRIPCDKNLDDIFDVMIDFLRTTPTTCIAFAQGGDFIGGPKGLFGKKIFLRRKVMNSFFCKVSDPFDFFGIFNDDVNAYIRNGNVGKIFFTTNIFSLNQGQTQQNAGGITEMYLDYGTYVKSFYSCMIHPTCARIHVLGTNHPRLHHSIKWNLAVPKIIEEKYKKK